MKPVTEEQEMIVLIEGEGDTKEKALDAAFMTLRHKVGGTLLRIEPMSVEVIQAQKREYTERFLFLFFPRIRTKYYLQLKVCVKVVSFCMENIDFKVSKSNFKTINEGEKICY